MNHTCKHRLDLKRLVLVVCSAALGLSAFYFVGAATHPMRAFAKKRTPKLGASKLRKQCGARCRRPARLKTGQLDALLSRLQKTLSFQQRLQLLSEMFLGTPYRLGPLGEGPKGRWDRDPTWRLDKVDCVTYVETVMALALASSTKRARRIMQDIRYDKGVIRFAKRNHFTAAQWLPVNQRAGYLQPLSQKVGGRYAVALRRTIAPTLWKRGGWGWWGRRLTPAQRPKRFTIWYVPLRHIAKVARQLPSIGWMGEVFDKTGSPVSVRHVGFFVRKRGAVLFRHANRPRVQETRLVGYARRHMWLAKRKRSKVIGFSFASLSAPSVRPILQRKSPK